MRDVIVVDRAGDRLGRADETGKEASQGDRYGVTALVANGQHYRNTAQVGCLHSGRHNHVDLV
jgi:hypothetical protein